MTMTDTRFKSPASSAASDQGTAAGEEVLWLDGKFYDGLKAFVAQARTRTAPADVFGAEREKVEAFLHREARLLDMRQYRDWIGLLATDFIYWIPASPDVTDARTEGSINFDDRRRMIDRVALIETNLQWSQTPRSRVCRMLSNIEVFSGKDGNVCVRSNLSIREYRASRTQSLVGWQEHELAPAQGGFSIRKKIIGLLDCDQPQGNTTFIL
jgi:benzoate/toluate 1,2-dioxygenase beta subunit